MSSDDGDALRMLGRNDLVLVRLHGRRVDGAAAHAERIGEVLIVAGAVVLGQVEAGGVAADARTDLFFLVREELGDPFGVSQELTAHGHGVDAALGNGTLTA